MSYTESANKINIQLGGKPQPDYIKYQLSDGFLFPTEPIIDIKSAILADKQIAQHGKIICKFKVYRK